MTNQFKAPHHAKFKITLHDDNGYQGSFFAGFENGAYKESEVSGEIHGHTVRADIQDTSNATRKLSIDGNAWRDLDCAFETPRFLAQVMLDGEDADEFLAAVCAELSPGEQPGITIS